MNLRILFRALGPIDLHGLRRDSMLSWMIFTPIFLALVLRFGVPPLVEQVNAVSGFDLAPYVPALVAVYVVLMTPMIFGMLAGFLLLDEKDDDTLTALQVSPLPFGGYLVYRIAAPSALAFAMTLLMFPLSGLARLGIADLLLVSAVAAPLAPLMGLLLPAYAENKVQGFALLKALGAVMILPVLAFFVAGSWEIAFGVLPTYWPVKLYWQLESGIGVVWPYALVGVAYQAVLVSLLARRLKAVLHR